VAFCDFCHVMLCWVTLYKTHFRICGIWL
jgi:hypothetical protein